MGKLSRITLTPKILREHVQYDPVCGVFTRKIGSSRSMVGSECGKVDKSTGYSRFQVSGVSVKTSRAAWAYMTDEWPDFDIDHENRNRSDNRWVNLRMLTRQENMFNTAAKGISWVENRKKWRAYVHLNGVYHHLGYFSNVEQAIEARLDGKTKYHVVS